MLETKDLVKVYRPKKGLPVTALNRVSLKFPDKGMVFLLGKSGSGKSTLLNVLGGLDSYENGSIIIKGVSSKEFKQQHFDSYRNTYVGFIFQEYNVLDEFTVGANIALAIELQGRKATDEEINDILKEVDLEGFGDRKPNELSGGQKQRVAIARALVKKPEIIMADEPTGALDSATGKAIFDTLKKLSKEKLVIVVSHDREFAENYADRIIELADGVVISDVELSNDEITDEQSEGLIFDGDVIEIPKSYTLTEDDRFKINEYIKSLESGAKLKFNKDRGHEKFVPTDSSKIKVHDGSAFKLIKSKLPIKNAFKIGASGLKNKKFKLVITIILSCISFGLFGLADTFGAYNHIETCTNSIIDTEVNYVGVSKAKKMEDGLYTYWDSYSFYLSKDELTEMKNNTGVEMHGVYTPINSDMDISHHIDESVKLTESDYDVFNTYFSGYAEINEKISKDMGFEILAGKLPDGNKKEVAISEYMFELFKRAKYTNDVKTYQNVDDRPVITEITEETESKKENIKKPSYTEIKEYSDILGKTLTLDKTEYTITAVIDTNFNFDRYLPLIEKREKGESNADYLVDFVLYQELRYAVDYTYSSVLMTGDGFVDNLVESRPKVAHITKGYIGYGNDDFELNPSYLAKLKDIKNEKIIWTDGEKTTLADNEIIVTTDCVYEYDSGYSEQEKVEEILKDNPTFKCWYGLYNEDDGETITKDGYKVVGYIVSEESSMLYSTAITSDATYELLTDGWEGYYKYSIGAVPDGKLNVKRFVSYCYDETDDERFPIQSSITFELDSINELLDMLSGVFLWIGVGFALFAALMLSNFIAISISYKKQEIGILRAIGSRSNDVFRIFFAESFIIAMINFVLSAIGVGVVTFIINTAFRMELGVLITVLTFNVRQIVLLFVVSVLVAFLASYIPVKKIASKRPIDAIRDK